MNEVDVIPAGQPSAEEIIRKEVVVTVNTKPVRLPAHRVTGLQIKEAAIAQGLQIELDFHLTEEAHGGHPARRIDDRQEITVTHESEFIANDGDDDA